MHRRLDLRHGKSFQHRHRAIAARPARRRARRFAIDPSLALALHRAGQRSFWPFVPAQSLRRARLWPHCWRASGDRPAAASGHTRSQTVIRSGSGRAHPAASGTCHGCRNPSTVHTQHPTAGWRLRKYSLRLKQARLTRAGRRVHPPV